MPSDADRLETALREGFASVTRDVDAPPDMTTRVKAARASRRRRIVLTTAIPVLASVASAVALTVGSASPPPPTQQTAGGQHNVQPERVAVAGFTFSLPATFTASTTACPTPHLSGDSAALLSSRFQDSASADGGCIAIQLVAPPPHGGSQVTVGRTDDGQSWDAHLVQSGAELMLTVVAPSARHSRGIVLTSRGLSSSQLLSIARSGFNDIHPTEAMCSRSCG